jgi:hypothetical protein
MQTFLEPTWGESQKIETGCTNSLKRVKDPYMLTGFLVQWVRGIYKRAENIENKKMDDYIWDEDPKVSRITIDPSFSGDEATERRRPGIYIKRTGVSHTTPGMKGGLQTMHLDHDGFFKGKDLTSIISGGHNFQCLGDTEAEAENIGLQVFNNLRRYTEAIKETADLGVFWVMSMSETQHIDKGKDYWMCVINVKWHYADNWTLDRDAPILKEIGFNPVI